MKPSKRYLLLLSIVLLGLILAALFLASIFDSSHEVPISTFEKMDGVSQQAAIDQVFWRRALPAGEESEFLVWAFLNHPEKTTAAIRQNSTRVPRLGKFMADACLKLIETGEIELGVTVIELAKSQFENDPDIIGVEGVLHYVAGNLDTAERLLDSTTSWFQDRPMINYYLGSVLLRNTSSAKKTRGKQLFLSLIASQDPVYAESAALILLAERTVPLLPQEIHHLVDFLEKLNVWRPDNSMLVPEDLRVIINRTAAVSPPRSLMLAKVLLAHPNSNLGDQFAMIALSQNFAETEIAASFLNKVRTLELGELEAEQLLHFEVLQSFMEENFEAGLPYWDEIITNHSKSPQVHRLFSRLHAFPGIPHDVHRSLLTSYLDVTPRQPQQALAAVAKMVELAPLREEFWINWAVENLLALDPVNVGNWLRTKNRSGSVVSAIGPGDADTPLPNMIALIDAHIAQSTYAEAQRIIHILRSREDSALLAFYQARIDLYEGNRDRAIESWQAAHNLALRSSLFPLLKNLGFLAIALEQPQNALHTLYRAIQAGIPFAQSEAEMLINLILNHGNIHQALHVSEYLLKTNPENPANTNNVAYLNFLLEQNVSEYVDKMRSLINAHPGKVELSLTLALGLLKQGRANEASRLLQQTRMDWPNANSRSKLIYAAVLYANDQRSLADVLLQGISPAGMLPEEWTLIR